jgi:hypothetical protein
MGEGQGYEKIFEPGGNLSLLLFVDDEVDFDVGETLMGSP